MRLWTLKEAVVKAKGTGINAPPGLKGFSVGFGGDDDGSDGGGSITLADSSSDSGSSDSGSSDSGSDSGSASSGCRRVTLARHAADANQYQLALFAPTPAHVAALCVLSDGGSGSNGGGSGNGAEPSAAAAKPVALKMWRCVPLLGEEPLASGVIMLGVGGG
jgi:4'-phosphopantetheinyl transferase